MYPERVSPAAVSPDGAAVPRGRNRCGVSGHAAPAGSVPAPQAAHLDHRRHRTGGRDRDRRRDRRGAADRRTGRAASGGALTEASAKAAIQDYLDALSNGDDETVARHTLCGLFDAAKERRSDLALAGLSSDAFRKQYDSAKVTSIDKMVMWSPTQAQVLFTMEVVPASGTSAEVSPAEEQAIAQLLSLDDEILVCSYLPRTAGQF